MRSPVLQVVILLVIAVTAGWIHSRVGEDAAGIAEKVDRWIKEDARAVIEADRSDPGTERASGEASAADESADARGEPGNEAAAADDAAETETETEAEADGGPQEPPSVEAADAADAADDYADDQAILDAIAESMKYDEITLAEAKSLHDAGGADFVDARLRDEFVAGHVPVAFHMPPAAFRDGNLPQAISGGFLPPSSDRPVIIYCGGGDCDASHLVADRLSELGFGDLRILRAGFPGWQEAGHPVETGPGFWGEG